MGPTLVAGVIGHYQIVRKRAGRLRRKYYVESASRAVQNSRSAGRAGHGEVSRAALKSGADLTERPAGIIREGEGLRRRLAVNRLEMEIGGNRPSRRSQRHTGGGYASATQFEKPVRSLIRNEKISAGVESELAGRGQAARGGSHFSSCGIEPPNLIQSAAGA